MCQKLSKSLDVCHSYSMQHQCRFFEIQCSYSFATFYSSTFQWQLANILQNFCVVGYSANFIKLTLWSLVIKKLVTLFSAPYLVLLHLHEGNCSPTYAKDGSAICWWDTQSWVGGKNVRTNHPEKILKNIVNIKENRETLKCILIHGVHPWIN